MNNIMTSEAINALNERLKAIVEEELLRGEFIEKCNRIMTHRHPDATEDMFETLYDAGARFK